MLREMFARTSSMCVGLPQRLGKRLTNFEVGEALYFLLFSACYEHYVSLPHLFSKEKGKNKSLCVSQNAHTHACNQQ